MCLDVYFNEDHSEADFITVNAGLHSLFWDYSFHVSTEEKEEYRGHAYMCRDNLETALSNLSLHLPATSNMILALLFGVMDLFIHAPTYANYSEGFLRYRAMETVSFVDLIVKSIRTLSNARLSSRRIDTE